MHATEVVKFEPMGSMLRANLRQLQRLASANIIKRVHVPPRLYAHTCQARFVTSTAPEQQPGPEPNSAAQRGTVQCVQQPVTQIAALLSLGAASTNTQAECPAERTPTTNHWRQCLDSLQPTSAALFHLSAATGAAARAAAATG